MTDKTIKKKNKTIALFMGDYTDREIAKEAIDPYHISWEYTMAVLQKIENKHDYFSKIENTGLGIYEFTLSQFHVRKETYAPQLPEGVFVRTDERTTPLFDARLEAVWEGCFRFIEWLNKQENT